MKRITDKQRQNALKTLEDFGRQCFRPESQATVSKGDCLAHGIGTGIMEDGCQVAIDIAKSVLEENNYHDGVAVLDAMFENKGTYKREGRNVNIVLPEMWETFGG